MHHNLISSEVMLEVVTSKELNVIMTAAQEYVLKHLSAKPSTTNQ